MSHKRGKAFPAAKLRIMEGDVLSPELAEAMFGDVMPLAGLRIRLFGGFEIERFNVPLPRMRSRTEPWLLALLLLRANREVERSWLAGQFWPESREKQAFYNLRRCLTNLRQALGEDAYRIVSPTPHTIAFDLTGAFCDVVAFDTALAQKGPNSLRRAVDLYHGPLLPGCDMDWILPERNVREQAYLNTLETLARLATREGNSAEAIRLLRQALDVEPLREPTHRALLEALATSGDRAGMMYAYRELRLRLHEELRTEPSAETRVLYQQLQERIQERVAKFPALPGNSDSPSLRIPWPVSGLIGREKETAEVVSLLTKHRLVTLTGTGGIGKTRLALAAATQTVATFPDGVFFVDLSPLSDPQLVPQAMAQALDVKEQAGQTLIGSITELLKDKQLLLILDNCEHLLDACATLATNLLSTCPSLRLLTTSREPLGILGEHLFRVSPLSVPDLKRNRLENAPAPSILSMLFEYESVRLFVERAQAVRADFAVTNANASALAQLCWQLDGIPLALELAAARIRSLSVEQIAERLDNRFRLLTGGDRTGLPRQQTLRALIDWSYDLLSKDEKTLLKRLSIFAGGWTLEAAESVCGFAPITSEEVIDLLTALIDKSLLFPVSQDCTAGGKREPTDHSNPDGMVRYGMLETIRRYALEKLQEEQTASDNPEGSGDEVEMVLRHHREFFIALAEEANSGLKSSEQLRWLYRFEREHDNLRAVLDRCTTRATALARLRLSVAMGRFWLIRGYLFEGRERLARALADRPLLIDSRSEEGRERQVEATVALALLHLGNMASQQGDITSARPLLEECLAMRRAVGDQQGMALVLNNLGIIAYNQADFGTAKRLYEQSLAVLREVGNKQGIANALNNLGNVASEQGDFATARSLYEECLVVSREIGDRHSTGNALLNLSFLACDQGDLPSASLHLEECLAIFRETRNRLGICDGLELAAVVTGKGESPRRAALFLGAADALREQINAMRTPIDKTWLEELAGQLGEKVGENAFIEAREAGRTLPWEEAVALALGESDKEKRVE